MSTDATEPLDIIRAKIDEALAALPPDEELSRRLNAAIMAQLYSGFGDDFAAWNDQRIADLQATVARLDKWPGRCSKCGKRLNVTSDMKRISCCVQADVADDWNDQ